MPNGRRIFAESNISIGNLVLPIEDFKIFADRDGGFSINPSIVNEAILRGEKLLGKEYPALLASDYMLFLRTQNRTIFQNKYMPRRKDALTLALAELAERKGRFLDSIINLLWMMCEETTWCLPAHNWKRGNHSERLLLPEVWDGKNGNIDLYIGVTGGIIATITYLLKKELTEVSPLTVKRCEFELERRIISPYLDAGNLIENLAYWAGVLGNKVNNWCPWIVSNILTVTALCEPSLSRRTAVVEQSMRILDNFTSGYLPDGACDEGPNYWNEAGGALYTSLLVIRDMTGGKIDMFENEFVRSIGEYIVKATVCSGTVLSVADGHPLVRPTGSHILDWGLLSHSDILANLGKAALTASPISPVLDFCCAYREFRSVGMPTPEPTPLLLPKKTWMNGVQIAVNRENENPDKGLYLMLKGGHNDENHNHNDVGEFVVFFNGKPILIDPGCGVYTGKTFGPDRYTIWTMQSEYHNLPIVNGYGERFGKQYAALNPEYDSESGSLSLDISNAYPLEAGLSSLVRKAELKDGKVIITDHIKLRTPGTVAFSLISTVKPEQTGSNRLMVNGVNIHFDPSLTVKIELINCSEPETEAVPQYWGVPAIYRTVLTETNPFTDKTYQLTTD